MAYVSIVGEPQIADVILNGSHTVYEGGFCGVVVDVKYNKTQKRIRIVTYAYCDRCGGFEFDTDFVDGLSIFGIELIEEKIYRCIRCKARYGNKSLTPPRDLKPNDPRIRTANPRNYSAKNVPERDGAYTIKNEVYYVLQEWYDPEKSSINKFYGGWR